MSDFHYPSAQDRANNPELDRVCAALELAEQQRDMAIDFKEQAEAERDSAQKIAHAALDDLEVLAARLAAAQALADEDRVDHPIYGLEGPFEQPGWKSKLGRDLHQALKAASVACLVRRELQLLNRLAREGEQEAVWIGDHGTSERHIAAPYGHRSRPHMPLDMLEDEMARLRTQVEERNI